jgi:SNF2 family DNA or RNA helicase
MALQEKKRRLVETALDEGAGRGISRLGRRELGYLFGLNRL